MNRLIPLALVHMLTLAAVAGAQTADTSALQGTVTDQTGGVVVGVSVALENDAGVRLSSQTDSRGRYSFEKTPPGRYTVTAGSEGFQDFTAPVDLRPRRSTSLDIVLRIAISVSLEVTEPTGLSTDPRRNLSARILTGKDIEALPNDPQLLMQRLLEMAGAAGRPGDVAVFVDGFREYKRFPPKETIEMIRINSNPFSAEFAGSSSKRIEITTKPGSDGFHGDAITPRFSTPPHASLSHSVRRSRRPCARRRC